MDGYSLFDLVIYYYLIISIDLLSDIFAFSSAFLVLYLLYLSLSSIGIYKVSVFVGLSFFYSTLATMLSLSYDFYCDGLFNYDKSELFFLGFSTG